MRAITIFAIAGLLGCLAGHDSALAESEQALQVDFGVGVMAVSLSDNLDPKGSSRYLDDLDNSPDHEMTVIPLLVPQVSYDIGSPGAMVLQFYAKPLVEETSGPAFSFGGSYALSGNSAMEFGAFIAPFEELWEDPYLIGVRRATTDSTKYGLHLSWTDVLGSSLALRAVVFQNSVDNDLVGQRLPDLQRDGLVAFSSAEYGFPVSKQLEILPQVAYVRGAYDGASNSFNRYRFGLGLRYRQGRLLLRQSVYYRYTDYDRIDPVFNTSREENGYGAALVAIYAAPFGWQHWTIQGQVGYGKGDTNIAFYDTESVQIGTVLYYRF